MGGRLLQFSGAWREEVQDKWVVSSVSLGYKIEFLELPPARFLRSRVPKDPVKREPLLLALDRLLSQGVIVEMNPKDQGSTRISSPLQSQMEMSDLS